MAIEIVSCPINSMVDLSIVFFVNVYQRVIWKAKLEFHPMKTIAISIINIHS